MKDDSSTENSTTQDNKDYGCPQIPYTPPTKCEAGNSMVSDFEFRNGKCYKKGKLFGNVIEITGNSGKIQTKNGIVHFTIT